jgi:putative endonuclease
MQMKNAHRRSGAWAEVQACRFLKKQGLSLLARNFTVRMGEIDLIMREGQVIIFVEVRYRKANSYVKPLETINTLKRKRLIRTALFYLQYVKKRKPFQARFDMIGIEGKDQINWIKNIFMM